jgi:16S rRNA (cytidine1402-2'-O)-methyltransferase
MVSGLWQDADPDNSITGVNVSKGVLYVVATPIGNLEDITFRAVRVLGDVDLILAEDTRHTRPLLRHYGITTPVTAVHEHNEQARLEGLLARLEQGESLALVADAGTPLISDPGFPLVREAVAREFRVVPIPGPSALTCALSASGLPTDRFLFAGFPPRQSSARRQWLEALAGESATLILYESSHRILATLEDLVVVCGERRQAVVARELTKQFETLLRGELGELRERVVADTDQQRGEFVILVHGHTAQADDEASVADAKIIQVLAEELPIKQAARLAASITGGKRNAIYQRILRLKGSRKV